MAEGESVVCCDNVHGYTDSLLEFIDPWIWENWQSNSGSTKKKKTDGTITLLGYSLLIQAYNSSIWNLSTRIHLPSW